MIFVLPTLSRVTVPAAVASVPGAIADELFVWPRPLICTGVLVLPADGDPVSLGPISLGITDENNRPIVTDYGATREFEVLQPFAAPCLGLFGKALHPFTLQRKVAAHDRWFLTLKNASAAGVDIASTALFFEELEP